MVGEKRLARLLQDSFVVWIATTCPDGAPHVVPAWFVWDGRRMLIPTRPGAQKVRNVAAHPAVMFGVGPTEPFFGAELARGTATVTRADGAMRRRVANKYRSRFAEASFDQESFWRRYTSCLVVLPAHQLDWGARETVRRSPVPSVA